MTKWGLSFPVERSGLAGAWSPHEFMDQGFDLDRKKRSYGSHSTPSYSIQIILGTLRPSAITCKPDGIVFVRTRVSQTVHKLGAWHRSLPFVSCVLFR